MTSLGSKTIDWVEGHLEVRSLVEDLVSLVK